MPAARRRRPGRRLAAAAAGLAVLLLAACATVPDSGSVQQGTGAAAAAAATGGQGYLLQPITMKPQPGWSAEQIVSGFLNATASFAGDYAAARQYLEPGIDWQPDGFAAVVIGSQVSVGQVSPKVQQQQQADQVNSDSATVLVTGQQLATVTSGGQYQAHPEHTPYNQTFQLRKIRGQWRISRSPPTTPPLYESDFHRVYLPRELYFMSGNGNSLVPDPVFVPLQANAVDVARHLVNALQYGQPPWLYEATSSALSGIASPASVTMDNGTATVALRMPAASIGKVNLRQVMAQLVWTLAGPSFGQSALVQSVQLEVNGHRQPPVSWSSGRPTQGGIPLVSVPRIAADQPLYSVVGHGVLQRLNPGALLSHQAPSLTPIPVHAGDAETPLGATAVSAGGRYVAWVAQSGRAVYYGLLKSGEKLDKWAPPHDVTSIDWAANGSLWVVAGGDVWMLQPGHLPVLLGGTPPGRILSMQVAPDNVRAVMIVKSLGATHLVLGAITYFTSGHSLGIVSVGQTFTIGADVTNPTHVAWYDPDDVIVLSAPPSGPLLQQVPVNGGGATALITPQDTRSISSAGPANPLVAGLSGGRLALTNNIYGTWTTRKNAGQYPTYPAG
ncbi:MAG TPA: LpqB family beta-propeller domain-containing protein [Streptosporangiaceae bacterium]